MLKAKFAELSGTAFEDFFHAMMEARDPSFVAVRTAGSLGDQGADGICLFKRKLYACYAPETYDASKVAAKFDSDLRKALEKRKDQFDEFVFVHNELRGVHPELATLLAAARDTHAELRF